MVASLEPRPLPDYQALFEAVPGLYLVLDRNLVIVAVSNAYAQATKTRREDIIGRGLFDIFPDNPDDPEADGVRNLRASLQHVLQSAVPDAMPLQKYDIRKPEEEGGGFEARYWSPLNTPVIGADGQLAYIIHRVQDVTDFVRLKQQGVEESRLNESLRERAVGMEAELFARSREVAEASAQLKTANDELARLYAKTREIDELKTRFFANVSHELRTPLTLILGPLARLLDSPQLAESDQQALQLIQRNALLLHRQVDNLLDIAKLEAGKMFIHYAELDLADQLRLLSSHFDTAAADRNVRFSVDIPESVPVQADDEKVQRIVLNLLSNAFKFVPDGGAVALSLEAAESQAVIRVRDNGPGVPEAMREAIFERFLQVDSGIARNHGGTGLGLAIVREFASLHRGSATVAEAPGGGAEFVVKLPLMAPPGSHVSPAIGKHQRIPAYFDEHAKSRLSPVPSAGQEYPLVLVVEDNPDMHEFIASSLAPRYRIASAFNGQEGLEKAKAIRPDLILSDVMMPGMSGDQMVAMIRQDPFLDDTPIVMLTAKADDSLRVRLLQHGVQDYIYKPFSVDELQARIAGLLSERTRVGSRVRHLEERFRATFEQAAVGIAHVSPDGRWLRVNQKLCDIVGYGRDALLAMTFLDITYPPDLDADLALVQQVLAREIDSYQIEKRYVRKDGELIWINLSVSLVRDERGAPDYFILVVEDIQQRKVAEEEVVRLNAGLEQRVSERTVELQAANRELDSFAYAVSHDLRAPLRAIIGFSHALEEDCGNAPLPEAARDSLHEILEGGRRMGELIDGILALSRSTRGGLLKRKVDISAIATRQLKEMSHLEPERKVTWEVAPGLAAHGDPRMLDVVLGNLLGNAWKYTAHVPSPHIRFFAETVEGKLRYCVSDNGDGFDMRYAEKLFQPFQRLHSHSRFPGIGIGLATAHRIITRHGGEIDATAVPGGGASFHFTLPEVVDDEDDTE